MQKPKRRYKYKGGVIRFGQCVGYFEGITEAVSKEQALNNFKMRAKRKLGLASNALIELNPLKLQQLD